MEKLFIVTLVLWIEDDWERPGGAVASAAVWMHKLALPGATVLRIIRDTGQCRVLMSNEDACKALRLSLKSEHQKALFRKYSIEETTMERIVVDTIEDYTPPSVDLDFVNK